MTNNEIRKQLIAARDDYIRLIKAELMGPGPEFAFPEKEQELISSSPLNRYPVGILFPQGNIVEQDNDETVPIDEEASAPVSDDVLAEQEPEKPAKHERDLTFDETADENLDEEIGMATQYKPSSMGITFLANENPDVVHCKVSFATYRNALASDCVVPYEPDELVVHIAICDDDETAGKRIAAIVTKHCDGNHRSFEIQSYVDSTQLLRDFRDNGKRFDILLLDGVMEPLDGHATARAVRETDRNAIIIFISSYIEFAVSGYEVEALRFVDKASASFEKDLRHALDSAFSSLRDRARMVSFSSGNHERWYNVDEIRYIEVMNRTLLLHLAGGIVDEAYGSIARAAQRLKDCGFVACHRCYLVNLSCIRMIRAEEIELKDGLLLPLGRSKRQTLTDAFTRYLGGR